MMRPPLGASFGADITIRKSFRAKSAEAKRCRLDYAVHAIHHNSGRADGEPAATRLIHAIRCPLVALPLP